MKKSNKNKEIIELIEEILSISTLGEKNILIGMLKGFLWNRKKE